MDRLARLRVPALLAAAFLLGGATTEVALRTRDAVDRVRADRALGSAGHLVSLEVTELGGEAIASPRVIAPSGRSAELVLRDPVHPEQVRLAARIEAERDATGDVALDYSIWVPDRAVSAQGTIALTPGVEQSIRLGDGTLVATWLAVPVPSAAFDAWLEAEREQRIAIARRRSRA